MPNQDLILVAKFKRTHGVKGHIRLHSYTDPITNVLDYPLFIKQGKNKEISPLKIESTRKHNSEIIIKLAGIDTPEEASKLTNQQIYTTRNAIPEPKADDEVYWVDLVGCNVQFEAEDLGTITKVMETGSNEVLVVKNKDKQYLIPYTNDAVGEVDTKNKKIELLWHPEDML